MLHGSCFFHLVYVNEGLLCISRALGTDLELCPQAPSHAIKMKLPTLSPLLLAFSFSFTVLAAPEDRETYDYIVIGSGPGGGTLAANLAKAGESVLLLEAGDDQGENLNELIAGWFFMSSNDATMRWDFFANNHSNDTINDAYEHLTWRTVEGEFYVGLDPPTGAVKLGV